MVSEQLDALKWERFAVSFVKDGILD